MTQLNPLIFFIVERTLVTMTNQKIIKIIRKYFAIEINLRITIAILMASLVGPFLIKA